MKSRNNEIFNLIKEICLKVVESSKPTGFYFGTVIQENPIMIQLSQQLILSESFLIIPYRMRDLDVGEKLILARVQGGQKYIVMDKVV